MAEERLIDDDKDRKFKIRKNADGEDELVLNENYREETTADDGEEMTFEVPDFDADDEEAAVMTPEQLAAREKKREEDEAKRRAMLAEALDKTRALLRDGKYGDAVYASEKAEELGGTDGNGEIHALKLRALTSDLTDFSSYEEGGEAVKVLSRAGENVREELSPYAENLNGAKEALENEISELDAENEEKKSERRIVFREKRKKSLIFFAAAAAPLLLFTVLAIYFSTVMYAQKDGSNITLFFVFLALAIAFFIATVVTAKFLWKNANNCKRNEKNSSTKLGRTLDGKREELKFAESVTEILNNDISR